MPESFFEEPRRPITVGPTSPGAPRALVIQHVAVEGPGRIATALRAAGFAIDTVRIDHSVPVPRSIAGYSALIVMGGPMGVYDVTFCPHLNDERALIESAFEHDVPTLGICLGSQLIAAALGARVVPSGRKEIGFYPVELSPTAQDDPLFTGLPRTFTPLHWHGDVFDLPVGATHLARSAMTAHQAFRYGQAWAILFHLEADQAAVQGMTAALADEVAEARLDPQTLIDRAGPATAASAPIGDTVFTRFAQRALARAQQSQ